MRAAECVWLTEPMHRLHAATAWVESSLEVDNLQRNPPEPATLHLLGCEVLLRSDGTYLISDTSGG